MPVPATLVMQTVSLSSFQITTEIKKSIIQLSNLKLFCVHLYQFNKGNEVNQGIMPGGIFCHKNP